MARTTRNSELFDKQKERKKEKSKVKKKNGVFLSETIIKECYTMIERLQSLIISKITVV